MDDYDNSLWKVWIERIITMIWIFEHDNGLWKGKITMTIVVDNMDGSDHDNDTWTFWKEYGVGKD